MPIWSIKKDAEFNSASFFIDQIGGQNHLKDFFYHRFSQINSDEERIRLNKKTMTIHLATNYNTFAKNAETIVNVQNDNC